MTTAPDGNSEELNSLRRSMNDLPVLFALPAMWTGGDLTQIANILVDTLMAMLGADILLLRLAEDAALPPVHAARMSGAMSSTTFEDIWGGLTREFGVAPSSWPHRMEVALGDDILTVCCLQIGAERSYGILVTGSRRPDFPSQSERLLITVAANQTTIALKDAFALAEQRRLATELDAKVAQRTAELVALNEALGAEIIERRRSEAFLAQGQRLTSTGSMWWDVPTGEIIWSDETFRLMQCPTTVTPTVELSISRCHPEDVDRVSEIITQGAAAGANMDFEHRLLLPDGAVKHVHVVLQNVATRESPVFIGATTDITDRMNAERRIRRSETFLATGQKISRTGIFSWQVDTDEITFSDELNLIFEFEDGTPVTFERIIERVIADDLPILADKMESARNGLDNSEYEIRLKRSDGAVRFVRVIAQVVEHKDGHRECLGAVQDVTQWRLAEEARDHLRTELARVTSIMSLGEIAASIAHEVNQPLAGIITNANTCLRMLTADPPDIQEALETARRTIRDGNRAADVIRRLRALFRKKAATIEPVDLNEATFEVVTLLENTFRKEKIEVQTSLAGDLPFVGGDRVQLQQVIMNFLRNAMEALSSVNDRQRSILVRTEIADDDYVCLSVKDAGCGFTDEDNGQLFDAFYTSKIGGMGIGLSVSRSIITGHKGRIWAKANDGPGVTFGFCIPRYANSQM